MTSTVSLTIRLHPQAREFLEEVVPGRGKGGYITALLLQERARLGAPQPQAQSAVLDLSKAPQHAAR